MTIDQKVGWGVAAASALVLGFALGMDHGVHGIDGYAAGLTFGGIWGWILRGMK